MSIGDCLMGLAIVFFILSGLAKATLDGQPWLALALVLVGLANAILMTLSNTKPAPPARATPDQPTEFVEVQVELDRVYVPRDQ